MKMYQMGANARNVNKSGDILRQLDREYALRPELAQTIDLHRELIVARATTEVPPIEDTLTREEAERLLNEGLCLLRRGRVELAGEEFARLCVHVCDITARHRPDLGDQFKAIRDLLVVPSQSKDLATQYLSWNRIDLPLAEGLDQELLAFVLNNALHPFLEKYAEAMEPLIDKERWYLAKCPVCGGQPDFSYLTQESGARYLLCSRCDTEWPYKRSECPFCGNTDSKTWGYYPSEDGSYRLYVCDQCGHYLKTLDLRQRTPDRSLAVERILSVAMDLTAREKGYR